MDVPEDLQSSKLQRSYYHLELEADVLKVCWNCLLSKAREQQAPVRSIKTSYPLQLVMMDYLTAEEALRGYKYLLVIVVHFTKLEGMVHTQDQTVEMAAVWKKVIQIYGSLAQLHFVGCIKFTRHRPPRTIFSGMVLVKG